MSGEFLDEREFELVNIIGAKLGSNQRELSRQMELSLGQTNMLIRRLVAKGYIRITQLNKKKIQYLLTPKGFAEKMRKSVKYTIKTITSIELITDKVKEVVKSLYAQGERDFLVLGRSDFALLIEMIIKREGFLDCRVSYLDDVPPSEMKGTLLVCKEGVSSENFNGRRVIDFIHELSKDDYLASERE
mgnify:FL=1